MAEQTPTEGRFVKYKYPGSDVRPAIITHVYPSTPAEPAAVDLTIFNRGSEDYGERVPYSTGPVDGAWHWPPFVPPAAAKPFASTVKNVVEPEPLR